jgi:phosphate transport system substrate-binding protein
MGEVLTDQTGDAAWPIAGATFILMHKKPADIASAQVALKFFDWAYAKGGTMASDLDYVPMPEAVTGLVKKEWAKIVGADGKPVM